MILVIDAYKLVKGMGKSLGIYNLARSVTQYLGKENVRRGMPEKIIVLGNEFNRKDFDREGVEFVPVPGNPKSRVSYTFWELLRVVKYAKAAHADRILFPRGYRPLFYSGKDTIIVHDLIPFWYDRNFPGYLDRLENAYIMNRLKASIKHADRVITISDYSKAEIEKLVPGSGEKVCEIYNGVNDMEPWSDSADPTGAVPGTYIAAVTTPMPHKNAKGILLAYEAYHRLCQKEGVTPLKLEAVGIGKISDAGLEREPDPQVLADIRCHRYIEKYSTMCRLIAEAKEFLFLSYAEGFGFPPIEAMQLGTPVVCSDRTSLKEVVADAGITVDPDDLEGTAAALLSLQRDDGLCKDLVKKGYENVKRFSWESRTKAYWNELFREDLP